MTKVFLCCRAELQQVIYQIKAGIKQLLDAHFAVLLVLEAENGGERRNKDLSTTLDYFLQIIHVGMFKRRRVPP